MSLFSCQRVSVRCQVVVNEPLQVWSNMQATVTREHLLTLDRDSLPSEVFYEVTQPQNGILTLRDYTDSVLSNFTQQQIDDGDVIFQHQGEHC